MDILANGKTAVKDKASLFTVVFEVSQIYVDLSLLGVALKEIRVETLIFDGDTRFYT